MRNIELINNIIKNSNDKLYIDFVKSFYSYIPLDYLKIYSENEMKIFCDNSYKYLKQSDRTRKCWLENINSNLTIFHIVGPNRPFIVDSIKMLLDEFNINYDFFLHPVIQIERDTQGSIISISQTGQSESIVCITIREDINPKQAEEIAKSILTILEKVDQTYTCWGKILDSLDKLNLSINSQKNVFSQHIIEESKNFLEWLKKDNFTFLGYLHFDKASGNFTNIAGDETIWGGEETIQNLLQGIEKYNSEKIVEVGKLQKVSSVHRSNFIDYILIKNFNADKTLSKVEIIIGLYSSNLDYQSVKEIPFIRDKLSYILQKSNFITNGYNEKKLKIIVQSLPRVALFHIDEDELYNLCINTLSAMSVGNLKFFRLGHCKQNFAEIILFMPRKRFTPENHQKIQAYLQEKFGVKTLRNYITEVSQNFVFIYTTFAAESCNLYTSQENEKFESDLENMTSIWEESFLGECKKLYAPESSSAYLKKYSEVFPVDYQFNNTPYEGARDISYLNNLNSERNVIFKIDKYSDEKLSLKIFSNQGKLTLSDTMPLLENLGFNVLEEQAYSLLKLENTYIHKYSLVLPSQIENFEEVRLLVEDALHAIYSNKTLVDYLSKLITFSKLSWREVDLVRTIAYYMHQTNYGYDYKYVSDILTKHFEYTKSLIKLFKYKFDIQSHDAQKANEISLHLRDYLIKVTSSAEDKVLRTLLHIVEAAVRTNYYQKINDEFKTYISIKFNSSAVPDLPLPIPYAEIFVFANDFEAIHLRGGKVARGGLRWSDRGEDYRVEVLGLMKAQMTKNSVIVPVGSKGGFYTRFSQEGLSKEEYTKKAISCYQNFLRGLLDITDNIIGTEIIHPKDTIIYDEKDPYLVVAADKGTATFSDYANQVSKEYNFWLQDAFASGGSAGYDHKKMGITAKGAWISVQRHFKDIGIDVQKDSITVVGIGDMSGDVFGNGLLLSRSLKLVSAFNHMHIFIDPRPDSEKSFLERERLFALQTSKWPDYSAELISKGGGIFDRKAKSIILSAEIKTLFEIEPNEVTPDELIRYILKSNVDLIWNGGIGTYVKASSEENYSVGDKTNDILRVNGNEVRAKVIGEGGNLGMTQKGRIEYARNGGRLNTDFIDNSAGVDCSDHEVNIKIALGKAIEKKSLTLETRNKFLSQMTEQVGELVLKDNKDQTLAITIMEHSPIFTMESYCRLIDILEQEKLLQRKVEFIPSNSELMQRAHNNEKLTRPELSILLSYSKRSVYNELQNTKLIQDEYFQKWLLEYFPEVMSKNFEKEILAHPLRNEIILTEITNKLVNQLSGPVISSLKKETGALLCDIARGFVIVREIFNLDDLWLEIEKLPSSIPLNVMIEIYTDINKVIRRGIVWMIMNLEHPLQIANSITLYKDAAIKISNMITKNLHGQSKDRFDAKFKKYTEVGIHENIAEKFAKLEAIVSSLDIAFIAKDTGANEELICSSYFKIASKYSIDWIRKTCDKLMTESYWQRLSLQSLKDDMYDKQRRLIKMVIDDNKLENLDSWFNNNEENSQIFNNFVEHLKLQENVDISMIILANKKLEMFIRKV